MALIFFFFFDKIVSKSLIRFLVYILPFRNYYIYIGILIVDFSIEQDFLHDNFTFSMPKERNEDP